MRFKRLSNRELESLEKDFIYFLSANSVTADDWKKLLKEDEERAEGLIEIFSDLVYEKALQNAKFLEQISEKEFMCYQALDDSIELIGLKVKEGSEINLNTPEFQTVAQKGIESGEIELIKGSRKYAPSKEEDLFNLMEKGAYLTDGAYYELLSKIVA